MLAFQPLSFGNYRLLRRIAVGGMAEVFRARALGFAGFQKLVAVKRMLPGFSGDDELTGMFVREAKLAANLSHPNIVQVLDFGRIQKRVFLAMEYIHGKDLWDINQALRRIDGVVPVELVCHIFIEVLNGLEYFHRATGPGGVPLNPVHRDLSPHNIMISYQGGVKIIDFGLVKGACSPDLTATGILKGKYSYMSPEQTRGEPLDQRSDLFSLAICLVEMLTRKKLFEAESELAVMNLIREARFPPVREFNDEVPEKLESILRRALARDPRDRFASAGEFRDELSRFLASSGLHFSQVWLGGFMGDLFREDREREAGEIGRESQLLDAMESREEEQPRTLLLSRAGPVAYWMAANRRKHSGRSALTLPARPRPVQENPPPLPVWYSSEASQLMRWVDQGVAILRRRSFATEVVSRNPVAGERHDRAVALGLFLMALVVMLI